MHSDMQSGVSYMYISGTWCRKMGGLFEIQFWLQIQGYSRLESLLSSSELLSKIVAQATPVPTPLSQFTNYNLQVNM